MTAHLQAAEAIFRRRVSEDPAGVGAAIGWYAANRAAGEWPADFHDAIGQPYSDGWFELPQALAWIRVNALIELGHVGYVSVPLDQRPYPDRERNGNRRALRRVPSPFTADLSVEQHAGDEDGTLTCSAAIKGLTGDGEGGRRRVQCAGGFTAPLEVGACLPSRVHTHLLQSGALARWPYHSELLYIFFGLPKPLQFVLDVTERAFGL